MNNSSATDICVKFGDNTYDVYESKFLDLDVKFADVNGVNLFHVKSFVESYNKVNDEPIVEFRRFLQYDNTPEYLQNVYEIDHDILNVVGSKTDKKSKNSKKSTTEKFHVANISEFIDENGHWNMSNVIVYCYSNLDNTRGYWVCGEVLSRFAQCGNVRFAVMVDKLIAAIATFNEQKIAESLQSLTLDNDKLIKRTEAFKKECSQVCNYLKPEIGKDYVAYVEWIDSKNAIYIGSMDKKKFMKERAKKNDQGNPARYFIYAKDNKFGIQLRDLYRDSLIAMLDLDIKTDHNYIIFKDKVKFNGIQWKVRNCLQRVRVKATTPEV